MGYYIIKRKGKLNSTRDCWCAQQVHTRELRSPCLLGSGSNPECLLDRLKGRFETVSTSLQSSKGRKYQRMTLQDTYEAYEVMSDKVLKYQIKEYEKYLREYTE